MAEDTITLKEYMDNLVSGLRSDIKELKETITLLSDNIKQNYVSKERFDALERDVNGDGGIKDRVRELEKRVGGINTRLTVIAVVGLFIAGIAGNLIGNWLGGMLP